MATPNTNDRKVEQELNQVLNYVKSAKALLNKIIDNPDNRSSRYLQTPRLKNEIHQLGVNLGDAIVHASNL